MPAASQRSRQASIVDPEITPSIVQQDPDNCFRILLATDNHIGYAEKDPVRGQDAINTFREILEIAQTADVDFILLAGDLFHENRPSRTCMHQTIALLREYTMGDKPISFELLSDPMDGGTPGFSFPAVNYEDPNLNVSIPVFSIHGNHDDPQGTGPVRLSSLAAVEADAQEGALCALDVLSVAGVINYFGKLDLTADEAAADPSDQGIKIRPVLLRKGNTHLAMYGVGNVKDARMHYELRSNRVKMFMPDGGEVGDDDWFNMLLIHQNRVKHGPQQSVPEGMFDDAINLVIWGHEHDCRIWPEQVEGKNYYISQPGSSVATSLAPGEAIPKHCGILSIQGNQFQITEVPLKTVRPFVIEEVVLTEAAEDPQNKINLEERDTITAYLRSQVELLIARAEEEWQERQHDQDERMMLPLIRLKVETSEVKEMTNPVRFGQDFVGRVANPRDILQYYRKKKAAERKVNNQPDMPDIEDEEDWAGDEDGLAAMTTNDRLSKLRMATLVRQYLQAQNLEVLVENGLEDAIMRFVDKDDRDAIKDFVIDTVKAVGKDMKQKDVVEGDVEQHMLDAKENAANHWQAEHQQREDQRKSKKGKGRRKDSDEDSMAAEDSMMEVDSEASVQPTKSTKGRGKATGAANGRGKKKSLFIDDEASDDDEEEEEEEEVVPKPKGRAAPKAKAPAKPAPKAPAKKTPVARGTASKQAQLSFGKKTTKSSKPIELSDDD